MLEKYEVNIIFSLLKTLFNVICENDNEFPNPASYAKRQGVYKIKTGISIDNRTQFWMFVELDSALKRCDF